MQTLLILQGVPGAGKSTYAKEWKAESPDTRVVVNRDTIRQEIGCFPKGNKAQEKQVSEIEIQQIKVGIQNQKEVCIDATNLNEKSIKKWKELATEMDVDVVMKEFTISMEEAIERDKIREKPVGKKVLFHFFTQYYPDLAKKYFTDKRLSFPKRENSPYKKAIICDLDGTLAIHNGRNPFDFEKIPTDVVNVDLKNLLKTLSRNYDILFVSGRGEEERNLTETWLFDNFADLWEVEWKLYMRKTGDYRKDAIIKEEIYRTYIEPEYTIAAVYDDRDQCVEMWRNLGLLCCQVWYGDF